MISASNTRQDETSAPKSFGPAWSPVLCCATLDLVPAPARKKSIFGLPERENGGRQSTEKVEKCAGRENHPASLTQFRSISHFIETLYCGVVPYKIIWARRLSGPRGSVHSGHGPARHFPARREHLFRACCLAIYSNATDAGAGATVRVFSP